MELDARIASITLPSVNSCSLPDRISTATQVKGISKSENSQSSKNEDMRRRTFVHFISPNLLKGKIPISTMSVAFNFWMISFISSALMPLA